MKITSYEDLIREFIYMKREGCCTDNVSDVYRILVKYYNSVENDPKLTVDQINLIKVNFTDSALNSIGVNPTFKNRSDFAQKFFIYEPEKNQNDYLDWLKNSYVECNHEVVQKVQQEAAEKINSILSDLRIVARNIGINYTDKLIQSTEDLLSFLKITKVEINNK